MNISVIICTFNRSYLLKTCLDALIKQSATWSEFEVIIVDNNSLDDTSIVATEFTSKYPHFRYVVESQIGLSFARNTGFKNARTEWVLYIDDDIVFCSAILLDND